MARVFLAKLSACHASANEAVAFSDAAELNGCSRVFLSRCFDERLTILDD